MISIFRIDIKGEPHYIMADAAEVDKIREALDPRLLARCGVSITEHKPA